MYPRNKSVSQQLRKAEKKKVTTATAIPTNGQQTLLQCEHTNGFLRRSQPRSQSRSQQPSALRKTPLILDAVQYNPSHPRRRTTTLFNVENPQQTVDALQFLQQEQNHASPRANNASIKEINTMLGLLVKGQQKYNNVAYYNSPPEHTHDLWNKNPYHRLPSAIPAIKKGKCKAVCFSDLPSKVHPSGAADKAVAPR